ncbi:STAGA complex 65 subunit gamma-like isoform X2 [Venturia canescens]|nr:STAGA complex 65 subunit gamma-like isoform X2 [Venturia canescens]
MKSSKNLSTGSLWGELPAREAHKHEVITPDIIENVWRQVMDDSNSTDCDYQIDTQPEFIQLPMENAHVLNTINLHQQLRAMDEGTILGSISTMESQGLPDEKRSENPFLFRCPTGNGPKVKKISTLHHLKPATARKLLKHAVVVLLAHIGFETSSDTAIETLTDISDFFLRRISLLLKVTVEQGNHGFPDAMEKVLLEAGVGGVVALHDYYQGFILRFEKKMKREAEIMAEEQQLELSTCTTKMELEEAANKLQFEELDEFGNLYREVPTLQLLDPDMGFPPSLDAGFQMLHSLEQDE